MNDRLAKGLLKTLTVLRAYLTEIVVGGGWAPFLYHRYLFHRQDGEPIFTRDIDLMVKPRVPLIGTKSIDQLLIEAGLTSIFKSIDTPPLIHYEGRIDGVDVEIEFLTDLAGSETDEVKKVQLDLHAEALRYVSLVVENVARLVIEKTSLAEGSAPLLVKVPTPAAYIFHKGMVYRDRRDPRKREKDLYYIFDILTGCGHLKAEIIRDLGELSRKNHGWFRKFINHIKADFTDASSDGVLSVAGQRPPNAFQGLDEAQFRQFVLGTFLEITEKLKGFL